MVLWIKKKLFKELDDNLEDLLDSVKQEYQDIIDRNSLFNLCQCITYFQEENKHIVGRYTS